MTILDRYRDAAVVKIVANEWIDYLEMAKVDGAWEIINMLWALTARSSATTERIHQAIVVRAHGGMLSFPCRSVNMISAKAGPRILISFRTCPLITTACSSSSSIVPAAQPTEPAPASYGGYSAYKFGNTALANKEFGSLVLLSKSRGSCETMLMHIPGLPGGFGLHFRYVLTLKKQ